ncbi:MAG TPA: hypothetical protein VHH14_09450, partial [Solirubrobacterales bacterium]|nr:hypothetical protein [Solirubrobacterales bacterium]
TSGTGTNAQIGVEDQWGKTGTTENNGDAWFCGGIGDEATACVWVGYPDSTTPMETLYNGGPVMGGTFPALIWAQVMSAWREIQAERAAEKAAIKAAREEGEDFDPAEVESYVPEEGEAESYVPEEESEYEATPEPEPEVVEPAPETEVVPEAGAEEAAPEAGGEAGGGVTAG